MNDTFLNALLELSEKEKLQERRPTSGRHTSEHQPRSSSVLFSRPPSSILVSRPPSAACLSKSQKPRRPPSTSTLRPRHASGPPVQIARPPSASTIASYKPPTAKSANIRRPNPMKCNLCTDNFKFSSNTPCFDNYCAKCLEDHVLSFKRGAGCDCPLCKSGILLPLTRPSSGRSNTSNTRHNGASNLYVCNVCTNARLAKYRCNSCEEFFCEKCNKDFLRRMRIDNSFTVGQFADITNDNGMPTIKASGMDDGQSLDSMSTASSVLPKGFGTMCKDHEEEELRFYCKPCDVSICRDCKLLNHEFHEAVPLDEVYDARQNSLRQAIKLSNANIRVLHAECSEISSKRLDIDTESRDAESQIENHANEAKRMIDELSKTMIKTVRMQNTQSRGKLEQSRAVVADKAKMLQSLVEEGTKLIESENGFDVIEQGPHLTKLMEEADVSPTADKRWRTRYVFQPANLKSQSSQLVCGRLQTVVEGLIKEVPLVDLHIINTFNSDQSYNSTTALAPTSDGSVWVCNGFRNKIHRFNEEGDMIQSETLDFDVDDMVYGAGGTLYITEINSKLIRKLTRGKMTIFTRSDLYLRGITASKDGDSIIACGNDVPIACLRHAAVSKIYVFSTNGQKVNEILVHGTKGVSLYRICHNVNGEYIVSTGVSGQYYIIDESGEVKYRYKTSHSANGVASDSHGLIYLTACKEDTLYILDNKGTPIPSTYAMHKPNAVAIDKNDTIWVGDWSKVQIMSYKK